MGVTVIAMMKTTMLLANLMEVTAVMTMTWVAGMTSVQSVNVCNLLGLPNVLEFKTGLVTVIALMKTTILGANLMEVTAVTILILTGITTVQHVTAPPLHHHCTDHGMSLRV